VGRTGPDARLAAVRRHAPAARRGPSSDPPYTFVTRGVEAAAAPARAAAGDRDVHLGANIIQEAIQTGLLGVLVISLVPFVLGDGV
jgi:dihydrofolate reductase